MSYLYASQKSISKNELKRVNSCGKRSDIATAALRRRQEVDVGAGRQEAKGKRKETERGHEVSWFARRGCTGWS